MDRIPKRSRRPRAVTGLLAVAASVASLVAVAPAASAEARTASAATAPAPAQRSFERIAAFPIYANSDDPTEESLAEIVAATVDGQTLVYSDAARELVGFIDIEDPSNPQPGGVVAVGGSPTSVEVIDDYALVAVDSTEDFTAPTGHLAVVDLGRHEVVRVIDLAGQPDSVKVSPDGAYLAVVLENQRDEDLNDGALPQLPAGLLQIVDLNGDAGFWGVRAVDLTGLAAIAPEDPEPEFVDIDDRNYAVVTMQENNHVVIVDLATAEVIDHFEAGTVDLDGVDTKEDGVIDLTDTLTDVLREPDAVTWLPGHRLAIANEGDLDGGSRGFTIFDEDGTVVYDSGTSIEELAVRIGHYPEARSDSKGSEPESVEYGRYGDEDLLFVGTERASFIAVYSLDGEGQPTFRQVLPTGLSPEGLLAMPKRGLFVVASEVDDPPSGVRATVSIYAMVDGAPNYPNIVSADNADGVPIGWGALSGLAADPTDADRLFAVSDSFYANGTIFSVDVSKSPAVIETAMVVTGADNLDLEGIQVGPDGTFWVASEGNATGTRPNRILNVATDGAVIAEIGLPAEIEACRAASTNAATLGSGFEGLAIIEGGDDTFRVAVAQQRGWDYTTPECEDLDDDPSGADQGEPAWTRIWIYDPASGEWDHVAYELDAKPQGAAWIGLSEIVATPSGWFGVIERDNRTGDYAATKNLAKVDLIGNLGGAIAADGKHRVDLLGALRATNGWITDKPEGFTVAADGQVYVVTDNDGVDDWSGETQLLRLGDFWSVFWH